VAAAENARTSAKSALGFGALVRRHRLAASLSQEVLAERARLSVGTIAAVERGRSRAPRPGTVLLLAEGLDLNPQQRAALIDACTGSSASNPVQGDGLPADNPGPQSRHNLPPSLTSFVGRERDLADVHYELSKARLVTLTGPGGVGKTRLALEIAGQLAQSGVGA
jgi:transcriptional regulator with XRE-family HTH domain